MSRIAPCIRWLQFPEHVFWLHETQHKRVGRLQTRASCILRTFHLEDGVQWTRHPPNAAILDNK